MSFGRIRKLALVSSLAFVLLGSTPASAHCDGLDGPVVGAAREALETGDPNRVLIWVQPADEAAVRAAFAETIAVRRLGPQARDLADRAFFETIVRLHRAGEGAPYTGLQPAGRDLGPAIPLADQAAASGSAREVAAFLTEEMRRGVEERLERLERRRQFAADDVAAGREYIAAYVAFIHYIEAIHRALADPAEGHFPDGGETHGTTHSAAMVSRIID